MGLHAHGLSEADIAAGTRALLVALHREHPKRLALSASIGRNVVRP
ncbi:hypothetical protein [Novosphingobium sp. 9]|nr:hypothetical protein [Novosphingobium sp. 9]